MHMNKLELSGALNYVVSGEQEEWFKHATQIVKIGKALPSGMGMPLQKEIHRERTVDSSGAVTHEGRPEEVSETNGQLRVGNYSLWHNPENRCVSFRDQFEERKLFSGDASYTYEHALFYNSYGAPVAHGVVERHLESRTQAPIRAFLESIPVWIYDFLISLFYPVRRTTELRVVTSIWDTTSVTIIHSLSDVLDEGNDLPSCEAVAQILAVRGA